MADESEKLAAEMRALAASIPGMIDNDPGAKAAASAGEIAGDPPEEIYPFAEYASANQFRRGIAHVFSLAKPWIEGLHGPLENWLIGSDRAAESGEYLDPATHNRPLLCDGKRAYGGTIERYLLAHWRVSPWLERPMDWPVTDLAIALISYGYAFNAMNFDDIPGWPSVVDPEEFCFVASTPPAEAPPGGLDRVYYPAPKPEA